MLHTLAIDPDFDLLQLHRHRPRRYPHLLESAARGPQGRYDILFACPGDTLQLSTPDEFDFLSALDARWRDEQAELQSELPFTGGWFVYLGYELAGQIEPQLTLPSARSTLPLASATRMYAAVVHDHARGERWLVAEREADIGTLAADVESLNGRVPSPAETCLMDLQEDDAEPYLEAVRRVRRYIREGDVFQVNLSRQWRGAWPQGVSTADVYDALRRANPGPYNGLATWGGGTAILSTSPERLVEVRGECLQTRPIAGTRARLAGADDAATLAELRRHPKEQAEHIMLIDLERNDLGRISVPGSVTVDELMTLESYATVHHIVSNVQGRKRASVTPGEVIRAVFPGGTITGCPKVRCMEIIAELEAVPRGAYTGSMGYLNRDGNLDLNILIRTVVREDARLSFRAGAGIVWDSEPRHELEETRAKAAGMLRALRSRCGGR